MAEADNPLNLENLRTDVDAALARHMAGLAEEVAALSTEASALVAAMTRLLDGGKRFRASFAYWAFRACGGPESGPEREAAVRAAAALELFQAAALFHDDVLDCSDTRRGRPTAHVSFAAAHAADGLAGDSTHFGLSSAILLGNLALASAQRELTEALAALPAQNAEQARRVFEAMSSEVQIGQYLDVLAQAQPWGEHPDADEDRAMRVIRAKSASYSVRCPAQLGAHMAGADEAQYEVISTFANQIGEAFQLRDDVLGVFGDEGTTGKPAGGDLIEGKRTVLIARAAHLSSPETRRKLVDELGNPNLTEQQIANFASIIESSGALASVEETIATLTAQGLSALDAASLDSPGREMLLALADAATRRQQ